MDEISNISDEALMNVDFGVRTEGFNVVGNNDVIVGMNEITSMSVEELLRFDVGMQKECSVDSSLNMHRISNDDANSEDEGERITNKLIC